MKIVLTTDMKSMLNGLMNDGFSEKYARFFINCIENEKKNPLYDFEYGKWALEKGFLASSAYAYGLDEENYAEYLSDYDYYKSWPLNSWSRIWVDDKLTLKYMLSGTVYSHLMPAYYFYSTKDGLRELIDNPYKGKQDIATLVNVLKDKGALACKPNNGTMSQGFFKLSYKNGLFFINDKEIAEQQIQKIVSEHVNYIYTEYIYPNSKFAKIYPLIHTLRVMVVNPHGNDPRIVGGYMRFGTATHGEANYSDVTTENAPPYNYNAELDIYTGHIGNAKAIYFNKVIDMPCHPETHVLADTQIDNWQEAEEAALGLSKYFFNCEWMGFDFGLTTKGLKLMEINTHPEIKPSQSFQSFYQDEELKMWFKKKIAAKTR